MYLEKDNRTENALKERIKELTCLYEVTSILSNTSIDNLEQSLQAVAYCLKKGFQYPEDTAIVIKTSNFTVQAGIPNESFQVTADINVFNNSNGIVTASSNNEESDFLREEQQLLDNVALKIGNVLERIDIQQNEISLKRQMERADRLGILGEITAGIAHELNTPLANILGFAELLKEELPEHKNALEDLDKIIKNAIFSREVVQKLLFFSCEMPQQMQPVNLVESVRSAFSLLDASFKKAKVKYIIKIDDEELFVKADKIQLTQIIFNLIINAIYFSPENSLVTISLKSTNELIILQIADEGIGVSDVTLEKIFQPFFTTKPIGDGTGLGLSVVHGIVNSHKGTITVENNKKKGVTFTVSLPKS